MSLELANKFLGSLRDVCCADEDDFPVVGSLDAVNICIFTHNGVQNSKSGAQNAKNFRGIWRNLPKIVIYLSRDYFFGGITT